MCCLFFKNKKKKVPAKLKQNPSQGKHTSESGSGILSLWTLVPF